MNSPPFDKQSMYVGEGVRVQGRIETDGQVEIHGLVTGDVIATDVRVGPTGRVDGSIQATRLDISGVAGNVVNVSDRLLVQSTGRLKGEVRYGSMQIDAGASIFGTVGRHDGSPPMVAARRTEPPLDNAQYEAGSLLDETQEPLP
jgi:cytoskeletal protein CcmA (bactofilin family)